MAQLDANTPAAARPALTLGGLVAVCGTARAAGNRYLRALARAPQTHASTRLVGVRLEADLSGVVADVLADAAALVAYAHAHYPLDAPTAALQQGAAAERHYRDLLLKDCDLVSLGNLPEQDRHLALRQLELRRLYVPLRAIVEQGVEEEDEARKGGKGARAHGRGAPPALRPSAMNESPLVRASPPPVASSCWGTPVRARPRSCGGW